MSEQKENPNKNAVPNFFYRFNSHIFFWFIIERNHRKIFPYHIICRRQKIIKFLIFFSRNKIDSFTHEIRYHHHYNYYNCGL